MRKFIFLLLVLLPFVASAQMERSIVIDESSFAPVQTDVMSGVPIDKIGKDRSNRECARIKMRINRMTAAEIDELSVHPFGGNVEVMKCVVATEGNVVDVVATMEEYKDETYVETAKGLNLKMIYVEGGTFAMGSTSGDSDEKPVHNVTLDSYYIGETEITQAQWRAVMGSNPSSYTGDNRPVECVSWDDAQAFCKRLSELTGKHYVLPTEAQWEYAARGGNKSKGYTYSGSNSVDEVAKYDSYGGHANVKSKKPNELGIYDMSGNVWEWCSDWYGSYSSSSQTNPQGPSTGSASVLRGGSWYDFASFCRVTLRSHSTPSLTYDGSGFRVVCLP